MSPCPFCGHAEHPNTRCTGTSDDGRYPCACSYPDPENFAFVEGVTLDREPVDTIEADMLVRSDYRRFLTDPEVIKAWNEAPDHRAQQ